MEFLRVPLLIALGFCAAAAIIAWADAERWLPSDVRLLLEHIVPASGAVSFISAVATSLMTVTSITFSVLLIAVQQTASSLTPVVFDQYLRRGANRVYFGFFVGSTAFAFILLAAARQKPAPVLGGVVTLALTLIALVALLFLIHSTVDQMRPQSVVRSIHQLALEARERELALLDKCHSQPRAVEARATRLVASVDSGYVVGLDLDRLASVARAVGAEAVVAVEGRLGLYVPFGEPIARIVGADAADDSHDAAVRRAFLFDDIRDVDAEPGYAIDQLENIAWAGGSSAAQSPSTSSSSIRAICDLVIRWLDAGERASTSEAGSEPRLPVVYEDGAAERGVQALVSLLVATTDSWQAQTAAELVRALALIVSRLRIEDDRTMFADGVDAALPALVQHASLPILMGALERLSEEMRRWGFDADRLDETRQLLRLGTELLQPKPSSEPEAVHPKEAAR